MLKKAYHSLLFLMCMLIVFSLSTAFAETGVELLLYTGKIAITLQNNAAAVYTTPQEVKIIPFDSAIECLDGVAILKVGESQVVFEAGDKAQLTFQKEANTIDIVCLAGEINTLWNKEEFKIVRGQAFALNTQGVPVISTAATQNAPGPSIMKSTRARLADPPNDLMPDPVDLPHASPSH